MSCTAVRKTTTNSSRRLKLQLAVKMNGELQVDQAQRATERLLRGGIENWTNNAIGVPYMRIVGIQALCHAVRRSE